MRAVVSAFFIYPLSIPAMILGMAWYHIKNGFDVGMEIADDWLND